MSDMLSKIRKNSEDILAVVNMPGFDVVEGSERFFSTCAVSAEYAAGKSLFSLLGMDVEESERARIASELQHSGIATRSLTELVRLEFFAMYTANHERALVRLSGVEENSAEKRFRTLIDNNVAGIFQSSLEGILLDCNQAFCDMLGYEGREEMTGMDTAALYFTNESRSGFIAELRGKGRLINYEIELRRKDGSQIFCLENTHLQVNELGKETINGTIVDITAQKRAEDAIAESEERFATLASVSHEAVVFLDNNEIVDCNEQFVNLFGYMTPKEVIGKLITEFITAQDVRKLTMAMDISSANKLELRCFTRESKLLVLESSGIDMRIRGRSRRVFVMADITSRKKTEFALEQTVLRLRNVLENAPNAIVITTGGRIRYSNQAALTLIGFEDEDDLYDREFLRYIAPEYAAEILEDMHTVSQGGEADYKEIRISRNDGSQVDIGLKSTLTVFENKPSIQISITDISERVKLVQEQMRTRIVEEINVVLKHEIEEHKDTQLKLLEQEKYTRSLIDSSLDMIVACDTDFRITEFNKAAEEEYGRKRSDMIKEDIALLFASPSDADAFKEALEKNKEFFGELMNQRKGGKQFHGLMSMNVIRNSGGKARGYIGILRDITDFRANERKALEQKAKLESIFNSTENLMMWTMDRHCRLTSMNANFHRWAKQILGKKVKPGDDVSELLRTNIDNNVYQGQLEAFEIAFEGRPQQFELALRPHDGEVIWLETFVNPVYVDDKQEEVSCLVYDTTDRKQIEKRIRDSLKEKEVLLQEIHHRVKNNLQVISSILNLQASYVTDDKTLDILEESQNRIKSMSFIHETLYRTTDFSSINFSEYLRTLAYNLIQSYRLKKYSVRLHPNLDDIAVHIDQAIPCGLIVNELISNALKYAFPEGTEGNLRLDLHKKKDTLTLRIADDGVGLPSNFRYDKTDSLGVQLVYTLTEQLDGTIEVNSQPGKGTEFIITFDLLKPKEHSEE
jgi:PAS domain S-box-containing protein